MVVPRDWLANRRGIVGDGVKKVVEIVFFDVHGNYSDFVWISRLVVKRRA